MPKFICALAVVLCAGQVVAQPFDSNLPPNGTQPPIAGTNVPQNDPIPIQLRALPAAVSLPSVVMAQTCEPSLPPPGTQPPIPGLCLPTYAPPDGSLTALPSGTTLPSETTWINGVWQADRRPAAFLRIFSTILVVLRGQVGIDTTKRLVFFHTDSNAQKFVLDRSITAVWG